MASDEVEISTLNAEEAVLVATHARCLECDGQFEVEDGVEPMCDRCDDEGGDPYILEFLRITDEPLGFADDDDFKVRANGTNVFTDRWEYPAEQP